MRNTQTWVITWTFAAVFLGAGGPVAVEAATGQDAESPPEQRVESRGLWPSDRMIDLWFTRVARDMARDYGFDEYQQQATQELMSRHFKGFLDRNRGQLERLIIEFGEAQLAEEPPSPEFAAEWAQRALPLVTDFQGLMTNMTDEMRDYMTEDQETLLDVNMAGLNVAVDFVDRRLNLFAEGGFEPEIHWMGKHSSRIATEHERKQIVRDAFVARQTAVDRLNDSGGAGGGAAVLAPPAELKKSAPTSAPATPEKDEWARYVDEFIRKYGLDDEQQQKARSILQDQYAQRDQFYSRNYNAFDRLSKLYTAAKTDEALTKAEEQYKKLTAPLDTMFDVLKKRLDRLPTTAQRRAWAEKETAGNTDEKRHE